MSDCATHYVGEKVYGRLSVDHKEVTNEEKLVTAVVNQRVLNALKQRLELELEKKNNRLNAQNNHQNSKNIL